MNLKFLSFLAGCIILLSVSAAAGIDAETISVSPVLSLDFSSVPENIFENCSVTLTASSSFSDTQIAVLKNLSGFSVSNAAYTVNVSTTALNLTSLSGCSLSMPVSHKWNAENKTTAAVIFSNESITIENVSVTYGNETIPDIYCANLSFVPETVVLVSGDVVVQTEETPVPTVTDPPATLEMITPTATATQAASPFAVSAVLSGFAVVFFSMRRRQ